MSPLLQRIVAGMGANAFGQGVNIFIQLASLPFFLSHWDSSTYGVWLMLSAASSYISMAEVGMVTAAGNTMTMAVGAGDVSGANRVFQSALMFVIVVCAGIALVATPVVLWNSIPGLDDGDRRSALLVLVAGVLLSLFNGLSDAAFRATGRYAIGTFYSNVLRLAEWAGSIAGLLWLGSFTAVATGALLVRFIGQALMVWASTRGVAGLRWGLSDSSLTDMRAAIRPAASFMVFPLANALSFQGMTLLVGNLLGPAAVALFNTYRTLARVTVQLSSVFSHALWPEVARLHGRGDRATLQRVYRKALFVGAALAVLSSAAVYMASPWLLSAWSRGAIGFDGAVLGILLVYAAVGSLWHVPRVLLMATNQHAALAAWYAASSIFGLVLAALGGRIAGIEGVAVAMLAAESMIAAICGVHAHALLSAGAPRPQVAH